MSVPSRPNPAPERRCQPTAERAARSTHQRHGRGVFPLLRGNLRWRKHRCASNRPATTQIHERASLRTTRPQNRVDR